MAPKPNPKPTREQKICAYVDAINKEIKTL